MNNDGLFNRYHSLILKLPFITLFLILVFFFIIFGGFFYFFRDVDSALLQWSTFFLSSSIVIFISIFLVIKRYVISPLKQLTLSIDGYINTGVFTSGSFIAADEIGRISDKLNGVFIDAIKQKQLKVKTDNQFSEISLYMQAILNSIGEAVVNIDDVGEIININKAAEQMFGYRESELLGEAFSYLLPYASRIDSDFIKSIVKDQSYNVNFSHEVEGAKKDGSIFLMNLVITKVKTQDGVIYTGLIRDLTEQRTLAADKEKALDEVKEIAWRLDFALAGPEIGVWDYNTLTHVISWDERVYQLFGYKSDCSLPPSKIWKKSIHPHDYNFVKKQLDESVKLGKDLNLTFRVKKPDNQIIYIEAHARVVKDENGLIYRMVGTNRDVTEQLNLQELKQQALNIAEESLKLKSEFLASMSHEIRTPMNGVIGMLGLLNKTQLTEQQVHYISLANSSANSLLILINDILDFSKIEAGKLNLEIVPFDFQQQLSQLAESMAVKAQEKGLELILDMKEVKHRIVEGDPTRIHQVLTNLVGNAIKFTASGEILITAKLTEQQDVLALECSVKDTGIGISKEHQQNLFDSFTQVDASTTRQYGGTGLGLAIVNNLCQLMGGEVRVESKKAQGSIFSFIVYLKKINNDSTRELIPQINDVNILLIVENKTSRNVLEAQLLSWQANVFIAKDAEQAISVIKKHGKEFFKMALLDKQLKSQDALILHKKIKQDLAPAIKMIIMTLMKETVDNNYYESLGFSGYFPKPTTVSDLYNTLTKVLNEDNDLINSKLSIKKSQLSTLPSTTRILLVEDNRVNQAVVIGILSSFGVKIDIANNGIEALEKMQSTFNNPYHILLMDCQMPEMDGYQTTRNIRNKVHANIRSDVVIIAMTANAMKGDKDKCFDAGMDDYLAKPVDADVLEEKLKLWLTKLNITGARDNVTPVIVEPPLSEDHGLDKLHSKNDDVIVGSLKDESKVDSVDVDDATWEQDSLLKRLRNNEVMVKKLVEMFIEDNEQAVTEIKSAIDNNDMSELASIAHKIKGSARNLSFVKLGNILNLIETDAKADKRENLFEFCGQFNREYEKLMPLLEEFLTD